MSFLRRLRADHGVEKPGQHQVRRGDLAREPSAPSGWRSLGALGGLGHDVSMALDRQDTAFVAFAARASRGGLEGVVMKRAGGTWKKVGEGFPAPHGLLDTSLAIDARGDIYMAYADGERQRAATVMKLSRSKWTAVGSAGLSPRDAGRVSMALDDTGCPHVSYKDSQWSDCATVVRYNGSSWEPMGGRGCSGSPAFETTLVLTRGVPYIAYEAYVPGVTGSRANVRRYNGDAWEAVGRLGFGEQYVNHLRMAVDQNAVPYVAYADGAHDEKATVQRFNGSSWEPVGQPAFSAGRAFDIDIGLDSNGTPYVVFGDGSCGKKLTAMRYNGVAWEILGSAGASEGEVRGPVPAFDSLDTLYVAYTIPPMRGVVVMTYRD